MAASSINWLLALLKKPDWLVLVVMALILVLEHSACKNYLASGAL
jgi:hypothetical protein